MSILGGIITLISVFRMIYIYKGTTEGRILDYQQVESFRREEGREKLYKYTITYLVNGKTYIHQQKNASNLNLSNKDIIIKYNLNNPQKSRIKGDNRILYFGIILLVIELVTIFTNL